MSYITPKKSPIEKIPDAPKRSSSNNIRCILFEPFPVFNLQNIKKTSQVEIKKNTVILSES